MPGGGHRPVGFLDPTTCPAPVICHLTRGLARTGSQHARDAGVQDGALRAEQSAAHGVLEQGVAQPVPVVLGPRDQVGI